jgi:hypothetical protein
MIIQHNIKIPITAILTRQQNAVRIRWGHNIADSRRRSVDMRQLRQVYFLLQAADVTNNVMYPTKPVLRLRQRWCQ